MNINDKTINENFNNSFWFSKVFKILNDKQTTHELNMSIFS